MCILLIGIILVALIWNDLYLTEKIEVIKSRFCIKQENPIRYFFGDINRVNVGKLFFCIFNLSQKWATCFTVIAKRKLRKLYF